ncbi:MAG: hypothetical protein GY808_15875, partial [Gammaproteobacteria bacterium]|nr:hypothetical protein [Gammaproteobacteria bacterium]
TTLDAYIFGAGIWVGAKDSIGVDNEGNPIYKQLVTVGYNPNDGSSEFAPGALPNSDNPVSETGPLDRVLLSTVEMDKLEWPLEDGDGNKVFRSDQDGHAMFNDLDVGRHVAEEGYPVENRRLGIEIRQLSYCWSIPAYRDIIFITYDITNVTKEIQDSEGNFIFPNGKTLKDVYLGVNCDPDIGTPEDDQISYFKGEFTAPGESDPLELNLGINYDDDANEATFTNPEGPGYVGYNFMESPRATRDTYIDPANTILVPEGEQLGMTAFKQFILDTDPNDDDERYLTMRGFNPKTNQYNRFDSSTVAEDMRFIQCTGPFDMPPDSTVRVVVAVLLAQTRGELKIAAYNAQKAYNLDFILPSPPPSPNLSLIPGDKQVTVVWDNYSETVADPFFEFRGADSLYKEFDFEGYRVYRSVDAATWVLVDSCDVLNGYGDDQGLHYSYIDDDELINGYPYYYSVTAYDWNNNPESLESGKLNNDTQGTPRVESSDFVNPSDASVEQVNDTKDNVLQITSNTLFPFEVGVSEYNFEITNTTVYIDTIVVNDVDVPTYQPIYEYSLIKGTSPGDTIKGTIRSVYERDPNGDGLTDDEQYLISNQKSKLINGAELEFNG